MTKVKGLAIIVICVGITACSGTKPTSDGLSRCSAELADVIARFDDAVADTVLTATSPVDTAFTARDFQALATQCGMFSFDYKVGQIIVNGTSRSMLCLARDPRILHLTLREPHSPEL